MTKPHTLVHYVEHWAQKKPTTPALHTKRGGRWQQLTWAEYWRNVRAIAKAMISLGHEVGESVVIAGANHPEWVQFQFGAQAARGVPAPIYGTSTVEQTGYIVKDSGARILCCDTKEQLDKFLEGERLGLFEPALRYFTFTKFDVDDSVKDRVVAFEDVIALGDDAANDVHLDERLSNLTDDETCLMIYTSGTTGVPKGVEIDHGGQLFVGNACKKFAPQFFDGSSEYHAISYLPLSHQAEQIMTNVLSLMVGGQVYFCPAIADVKGYLTDVRPTCFLGVPRVWEKFEAALRARLSEATGPKAKLAAWSMKTELECFHEQVRRGVPESKYMPVKRRLARWLVISKIKTALGLDRLENAVTGSAPISETTQLFFASLGICIFEAYGLTETSGVATVTDALRPRFGTVGRPFDGVEIRIAEEDEIQLRGRNMVKAYRGLPEQTQALFTEDGWLRTGDAGSIDKEGNVKITGRLKELLITAGGKNVAPVELEFYLKTIPGIGQAVVVGDRQPYLCALLALDPENLEAIQQAAGSSESTMAGLAGCPKVRKFVTGAIETACNAKVARYQTIKKFEILPEEMTVEGGELTASLKLRRPQILEKHAALVTNMYEDSGTKPVSTSP